MCWECKVVTKVSHVMVYEYGSDTMVIQDVNIKGEYQGQNRCRTLVSLAFASINRKKVRSKAISEKAEAACRCYLKAATEYSREIFKEKKMYVPKENIDEHCSNEPRGTYSFEKEQNSIKRV